MAQRVGTGIALLFHDRGTKRGEWLAARPGRTLPPGKNWYPFYRRMGRPQGRSGRAENLVPTGIRFRTVQPIVSRYTDSYSARMHKRQRFKFLASGVSQAGVFHGDAVRCVIRMFSGRWKRQGEFMV